MHHHRYNILSILVFFYNLNQQTEYNFIMKKIWFSLCFVFGVLLASAQVSSTSGRLIVSKDGCDLQFEDGTPFFWLGDTAWELINKLTLDEIKLYLDNRVSKGFNVIQLTALSTDDLRKPNRYGETPLHDLNPLTPNEKYFAILDSVVELARERHMFLAIVATWGDKVVKSTGSGGSSVIFNKNNAYPYGKWLGSRYKKFLNVIWIMGGDVPGVKDTEDYRPIWREMARGIDGTNNQCLISYHPNGERSSSQWMQSEDWMDFNMIQSSHGRRNAPVWEMIKRDRSLNPVMPVLDSEPNYEDHPNEPVAHLEIRQRILQGLRCSQATLSRGILRRMWRNVWPPRNMAVCK